MGTDFFTELENTHPFAKVAFLGLAGSGKSCTAGKLAGGLQLHAKLTEPIILFDTETSSKFFVPLFSEHNIKVLVKASRTLSDLRKTMQYADEHGSVLIIDSITHVWENFIQAYMEKKNRSRLQFQDWGTLKPIWKKEFSDAFVMGHFHGIFTGRQGDIFDYVDVDGKEELRRVGIKMQAEKETAYEPDLLVNMERLQDISGEQVRVIHRATILKDRTMDPKKSLDGKSYDNPTFNTFLPYIDYVLKGKPVDSRQNPTADDRDLIKGEEERSTTKQEAKIWRERCYALLDKHCAGTSKEAKAKRMEAMQKAFHGELSETAIENMNAGQLEAAHTILLKDLEGIDLTTGLGPDGLWPEDKK